MPNGQRLALLQRPSVIRPRRIHDDGNVAPHGTVGGPQGLHRQPRGLVLDAKHKNIIVSDKFLNGVATYHFPELFEPDTRQTARAER